MISDASMLIWRHCNYSNDMNAQTVVILREILLPFLPGSHHLLSKDIPDVFDFIYYHFAKVQLEVKCFITIDS